MSVVTAETRTPWHLWVVGVLSLIWNAGGAFDYLMTRTGAEWYVANLAPEQVAHMNAFPLWMDIAWPIGVWGAVIGSIGLLLCKAWAVWAFGLSLIGLLFATIYNFVLTDGMAIMGGTAVVLFNIALWAVAILLLLYAMAMKTRGVLA
jgi:hypothetical protein